MAPIVVLQWFFSGSYRFLWHDWGAIYHHYRTEPVKPLCMVIQRFFSGSLGWLRCYIATLPYKELVKPFKGSLRAKEPLLVLFSTIFVEEIQCNMAPLMVLHSTIWQRYCRAPLKIWCYNSTKSGSPMITSQEPLLVLYSTIFFFWVYN